MRYPLGRLRDKRRDLLNLVPSFSCSSFGLKEREVKGPLESRLAASEQFNVMLRFRDISGDNLVKLYKALSCHT